MSPAGPDVWVGPRGSDALIVSGRAGAVHAFSCYGGPVAWEGLRGVRGARASNRQALASAIFRYAWRYAGLPAEVGRVFAYRPDPALDALRRRYPVATLPYPLYQEFRRKSFLLRLGRMGASVPKGGQFRPDRDSFPAIRAILGQPFVAKAADRSMYIVDSREDLARVAGRHPGQRLAAWSYLPGEVLSFHFCIARSGAATVYPPARRLVRPSATGTPFRPAGCDFAVAGRVPAIALDHACTALRGLCKILADFGYLGIGGADVVANERAAHIVDIKPRFQSSSLLLALRLRDGCGIELIEEHRRVLCPAAGDFPPDIHARSPVPANLSGQVFLDHDGPARERISGAVEAGVYRWDGRLAAQGRPGPPLAPDEVLVLDPPPAGTLVEPGAPLARLLFPAGSALFDGAGAVPELRLELRRLLRT